jgi:hypothetical protein
MITVSPQLSFQQAQDANVALLSTRRLYVHNGVTNEYLWLRKGASLWHGTPSLDLARDPRMCLGHLSFFSTTPVTGLVYPLREYMANLELSATSYLLQFKLKRDVLLLVRHNVNNSRSKTIGVNPLMGKFLCGSSGSDGCLGRMSIFLKECGGKRGHALIVPRHPDGLLQVVLNDEILMHDVQPVRSFEINLNVLKTMICSSSESYMDAMLFKSFNRIVKTFGSNHGFLNPKGVSDETCLGIVRNKKRLAVSKRSQEYERDEDVMHITQREQIVADLINSGDHEVASAMFLPSFTKTHRLNSGDVRQKINRTWPRLPNPPRRHVDTKYSRHPSAALSPPRLPATPPPHQHDAEEEEEEEEIRGLDFGLSSDDDDDYY